MRRAWLALVGAVDFLHHLLPAGLRPGAVSLHDGRAVVSWSREEFERATARWLLLVRG